MSEKARLLEVVRKLQIEAELDEQEAERLDAGGYPLQAQRWRDSAGETRAQMRRLEDEAEKAQS